jgi:methyl-accepting chemotaxis protein
MKNIPVLWKFLLIMTVFGAFATAVAGYSGHSMTRISTDYSSLQHNEIAASLFVAGANRSLQSVRGDIADLLVSTTDEGNQIAIGEIAASRSAFNSFLDQAAHAASSEAADLQALKARGLVVFDKVCAHAIALASAATAPDAVLAS